MRKSPQRLGQSNLLPEKGAKVALLTKDGLITGTLANWSDRGAVVETRAEVQAGAQVLLRVQGTDQIWEKKATVLWVNPGQGFGLEFVPDNPAKKRWVAGIMARLRPFLYASTSRTRTDGARSASKHKEKSRPEKRRSRRFQIESPAQVKRLDVASVEPDVTTVTETSNSGALFITDRDYLVGTELQIQCPFPSSSSAKQGGEVVRVEKRSDGRRRVAVVFK